MDFSHFLSSYYPDPAYGGKRLYGDMVAQAIMAATLGYRGGTLPGHRLIHMLLIASPPAMVVLFFLASGSNFNNANNSLAAWAAWSRASPLRLLLNALQAWIDFSIAVRPGFISFGIALPLSSNSICTNFVAISRFSFW